MKRICRGTLAVLVFVMLSACGGSSTTDTGDTIGSKKQAEDAARRYTAETQEEAVCAHDEGGHWVCNYTSGDARTIMEVVCDETECVVERWRAE